MYVNGDTYLTLLSKTMHGEDGHFIVWDEIGGVPLIKIDHKPIYDDQVRIVGVWLMGETKDGIEVDARWMSYDRRNSETHGYHAFLLMTGSLVGRAQEIRQRRLEERHGTPV